MKKTLIALMTTALVFVSAPAQAEDVPDTSGGKEPVECTMSGGKDVCDPSPCEQAIEDAFWTYSQLQWQIELTQRARLRVERKNIKIAALKEQIRELKHRLNK